MKYATFRKDLQEYFKNSILNTPTTILDPMAGVAPLLPFFETNGHKAYLYDILPLHYFINSAKRFSIFKCYKKFGSSWFFDTFIKIMSPLQDRQSIISDKWIDEKTLGGLVKAWKSIEIYQKDKATVLRALLLMSIKYFASFTLSYNNTWIKMGGISSSKKLEEISNEIIGLLDEFYKIHYIDVRVKKRGRCIIRIKDASKLRLKRPVDTILTSPPYCNRLDYVRMYAPENYFLSNVGFPISYNSVIGTNIVKDYKRKERDRKNITTKSEYLAELLEKIEEKSKKDTDYYMKYYVRYFANLFKTFQNLLNNISKNGRMYIVIQDNIHRGEIIEIDKALSDLFETLGYQSKIEKQWNRHHLGLRNISEDNKIIKRKHAEKLMVVYK